MSTLNEHLQLRHASEPQLNNMEPNGNGILDHFTSSPVSGPIQHSNDMMHGFYNSFKQHQIQRNEYDKMFEVCTSSLLFLPCALSLSSLGIIPNAKCTMQLNTAAENC